MPLLAYRIIKNPQINLNLSATNKKNKLTLDTTISFKIKIPPVSFVSNVYGNNFSTTTLENTKKFEQKIRDNFSDANEYNIKRAAILTDIILTKSLHPTVTINERSLPILKTTDKIQINILTDTVYEYSMIGRYPSKNNKDYFDVA